MGGNAFKTPEGKNLCVRVNTKTYYEVKQRITEMFLEDGYELFVGKEFPKEDFGDIDFIYYNIPDLINYVTKKLNIDKVFSNGNYTSFALPF